MNWDILPLLSFKVWISFMDHGQSETITKKKVTVKKPDMYKVIMLNDDFTAMEFVVEILMKIFQKDSGNAQRIMITIHETGAGEVGTYTHDIAQSKIEQVHSLARQFEYPLRCNMEKA